MELEPTWTDFDSAQHIRTKMTPQRTKENVASDESKSRAHKPQKCENRPESQAWNTVDRVTEPEAPKPTQAPHSDHSRQVR